MQHKRDSWQRVYAGSPASAAAQCESALQASAQLAAESCNRKPTARSTFSISPVLGAQATLLGSPAGNTRSPATGTASETSPLISARRVTSSRVLRSLQRFPAKLAQLAAEQGWTQAAGSREGQAHLLVQARQACIRDPTCRAVLP